MPLFDEPPLHDFPDRAIRKLLENVHNLRDLVQAVVPELAAGFDFERAVLLDRSFLMEDWRGRESDLLFQVPFRTPEVPPVLVCVLIEHQSGPDPRMPLRILLYAVLYWEREWKQWEDRHPRGEPLRLSPVLPIVFHTGPEPWRTNRQLADLLTGPDQFKGFAPSWQTLFWNLSEHSPQELLSAAGDWLRALAVVRAEQDDAEAFLGVFAEVLRRLESLSATDKLRWHDLVWFVLSWALRRRPRQERVQLFDVARASQSELARQQEVQTMSQTIEQTWEQELLARGKTVGALAAYRDTLRTLLEDRFGTVPSAWLEKIEAATDAERLRACIRQVGRISSPDELQL
jgi:hypothetical protein